MLHLRKWRITGLFLSLALAASLLFWAADTPADAVPASTTSTTAATATTGAPQTPASTTTDITLSGPVKIQVDALTAQADRVRAEIESLDEELEQKTEAYNQCLEDLEAVNVRLSELRRQADQARVERAYRVKQLEERIRAVYMSGGPDQLLRLLLMSDGVEDLYNRVRLVATLADRDKDLLSNLKDATADLGSALAQLDAEKREQLRLREELSRRTAEIQTTLAKREQTLAGLDARVKIIIEQERQRQREEQERLQRELEAALAAARAEAAARAASLTQTFNGGQTYSGKLPQIDNEIQRQVVETAAAYLGIPYLWGGSKPSTGMDCSGFVRWVLRQHGVNLPHYSGYQARMGLPVELADIQPGDVVAFGSPVHHVGIYIGDGLFIHAPRTGDVIKISKLASRRDLAAIRRFPLQPRSGPPLFD